MKVRTAFIIMGALGLAACGAGPDAQLNVSPEEMTRVFEAEVAAAVETQNAAAANLAQVAEMTVAAALAETAAAGGQPAPPVDEPPATETLPPDIPTSTPAPSATNTQVPTATFPADDPATVLGNSDFHDAFNNANNWSEYDLAGSKAEVKDGKFVFTKKTIQFGAHWTVSWPKIEDYYLQVSVETPAACSGFDRYGLIFRAPSPSEGLLFQVSCNGQYRIAKWDGSEMTFPVDWTPSAAINAGPNQVNRIGVMAQGSTIKVYVNGTELASVVDTDYVGEYRYGLLVGAADSEPFTVKFDDLRYWLLP